MYMQIQVKAGLTQSCNMLNNEIKLFLQNIYRSFFLKIYLS